MKTKLQRYRPSHYEGFYSVPEYGIECFYSESLKLAIFYSGKANKRLWHYQFNSVERMHERIKETADNVIRNMTATKKRIEERKEATKKLIAKDHFKPGDIIVNTWGYEQTNVDFFQVTEVLNKKIRVKEIYGNYKITGFECGNTTACKDEFKPNGDEYLLSLKDYGNGQIIICNPKSFYYFRKWDGKPEYESHYA